MMKKQKRSFLSFKNDKEAPGVTILRPLRGVDDFLEQCLRSSFEQKYPKFEIIMSVPDEKDLAIPIAQKLIAEYPKVEARLEIGEVDVGMNPKINNLVKGYNGAKYDIIWMYDSNVYMEPHAMDNSVNELLQPKIGLVHHLPRGIHIQSFGSYLESIYMGTYHARMYLVINFLTFVFQRLGFGASCVTGKSMMFRRTTLKQCGGLNLFGNYLAEDNVIGTEIAKLGLRHTLATDFASQLLGSLSVSDFISRRVRWARLRLFLVPIATLAEPFTECTVAGMIGAVAMSHLFGVNPYLLFSLHAAFWFLCDFFQYRAMTSPDRNGKLRKSGNPVFSNPFLFVVVWLMRELTFLILFSHGVFGNTVVWRGQLYRLNWGGTAAAVTTKRESYDVIKRWLERISLSISRIFIEPLKPEIFPVVEIPNRRAKTK